MMCWIQNKNVASYTNNGIFTKQHFFTFVNVLDKKNECLLATLNQTLRVLETHIYNLVQIVQALTSSNIGSQEKRANMS